jgi:hypothetical protein
MKGRVEKEIVLKKKDLRNNNRKYHHKNLISEKKVRCWRISRNITGRLMEPQ